MLAAGDRSRSAAPTYHPLALIVCALAAGIAIDRWFPLAALIWWLFAFGVLAVWLPLWISKRNAAVGSYLVLVAFLATGGAWHHRYWRLYNDDEIGRMVLE
ncbi:MAG: hypothetical protein JF612_14735 [Planctomycetia bacterium]|nr:hypothetical protein [Planctomycetia bacterium]